MKTIRKDKLCIRIFENRQELGFDASGEVADKIREVMRTKTEVNLIFASAPSQNEFLYGLLNNGTIQWDKVNAFHMDAYIGLHRDAPQGFGNFIRERLWDKVPLKSTHFLDGNAANPEAECLRYAEVPTHALTLTIPALMKGKHLFTIVPGKTKKEAVYHTFADAVGTQCPATILRTHEDAGLYVDADSAALILGFPF